MNDLPLGSIDQAQRAKESMTRRFYSRSVVEGEIADVGRKFSDEKLAHLRSVLEAQLATSYSASPRSAIVISYNAPVGPTLNYQVDTRWSTVEAAYEDWISTSEPPLFGTEPDARVWALANDAADPTTHRVLEVGAGTGA